MTEQTRNRVRDWLSERAGIVKWYADAIGAYYDPWHNQYKVILDGKIECVQSLFKGNEKALGLLVNHAYLRGAQYALYGFGIMRE